MGRIFCNLSVGDTHAIQATNAAGHSVTGLAWTSSDPTIVSLSTSDPPLLTAVAAGHATISAGGASADVTVWPGALPLGTVIWSNPGDGSGVQSIVPAVPSTSGVADVFAFQADGTVQAITSDGTTAWTADVSQAGQVLPDFQGGLVVVGQNSIYKLDGITGQPYPGYSFDSSSPVSVAAVHPDGTIFAIQDNNYNSSCLSDSEYDSVIGIDPTTGAEKFSVPLDHNQAGLNCPEIGGYVRGYPIVAGDGYLYVPYAYNEMADPIVGSTATHLWLLRVDSSGDYSKWHLMDWTILGPWGMLNGLRVDMITNADTGILFTWEANPNAHWNMRPALRSSRGRGPSHVGSRAPRMSPRDGYNFGSGPVTLGMGVANSAGAALSNGAPQVPGGWLVVPLLQAQDGSFVGSDVVNDMVAFDASGTVRWIVPNETPQIATADGGVIGQSGITYDQNGNATGRIATPTQSWTGNQYQEAGSLDSVLEPLVFEDYASFWPAMGGNPSGNGTAVLQCPCVLQTTGTTVTSEAKRPPAAKVATPGSSSGSQTRYLLMAGDPGLNLGNGHNHNVGQLFNLAAETQASQLSQSGNNLVITQRVSSFSDFSTALTANGFINGGVTFFGHAGIDGHDNSALFPGEQPGDANNISAINVGGLSNANLGHNITITLNACHAGLGGKRSIAQLIANKLQVTVLAYPIDMYFSSSPTPAIFSPTMVAPSGVPVYMVPNGNLTQPTRFPLQ